MNAKLTKTLAVIGALALVASSAATLLGMRLLGSGFSSRPEPGRTEEWMALKLRKLALPSRYERMNNPVVLSDAKLLEAVMAHWADHCATCHSNDGSGATTIGRQLYPRAPDMRQQRTQKMTDGELYYVINQGIRFSAMPAWGKPGDEDEDTWALVAFIRKLPSLSSQQVDALKAMNPVSAHTFRARQEEDDFLSGDDNQPTPHQDH